MRSRIAPSRSACAPGSKSRPACGSAMSSSSIRSATPGGTRRAANPLAPPSANPRSPRPADNAARAPGATFEPWYRFFLWEDWREAKPDIIERGIFPELSKWAGQSEAPETARALGRKDRVRLYFGTEGAHWDEERVLDRYELLYEAGLVEESRRDGRPAALAGKSLPALGVSMRFDHRRILATAMGRLRAKLKYRPVVFELLPGEFTLTELQRTVEAISGRHLHKQNFRRLVEAGALVEPTGEMSTQTGGRPAALFRFRRDVLQERPAPGLRVRGRR